MAWILIIYFANIIIFPNENINIILLKLAEIKNTDNRDFIENKNSKLVLSVGSYLTGLNGESDDPMFLILREFFLYFNFEKYFLKLILKYTLSYDFFLTPNNHFVKYLKISILDPQCNDLQAGENISNY